MESMKEQEVTQTPVIPIHILFADDDTDDHFFFNRALKTLPFHTQLKTVEDGEELMTYLINNSSKLPDVLFLDNNMPRKNGFECLSEIKQNPKLKELPVIIYSTYLHEDVADLMYESGAHFYIRKTAMAEIQNALHHIFTLIVEKKLNRPITEEFVLNPTTRHATGTIN
jgi:CheY-like chemotaxis protein